MNRYLWMMTLLVFSNAAIAAEKSEPEDKSPSKDKIQWLGTKTSLETLAQFDYVGGGSTDLGNGRREDVPESQITIRQLITRRTMRAFLLRGGMEYERFSFSVPDDGVLPQHMTAVNAYTAIDFRFSRKDLIKIQARPGLYSDLDDVDGKDVNVPMDFGYARVVSQKFQWAAGLSLNTWRKHRLLAGGGIRWQINDLWKLKLMLPEPQIEYKARDDLHVFVGGDFRGDTYRMSETFGTEHGNPALNNALMDYQEIRAGVGFSWNIKPLFELNMKTGYMLDRSFDFHEAQIQRTSLPGPYVSINFQALFELWPEVEVDHETRREQFQVPNLQRVLPNVPKIFQN